MRNVKILWAVLALLFVCLLVTSAMLANRMRTPNPESAEPPPPDSVNKPPEEKDQVLATIGNQRITSSQLQQKLVKKYGKQLLSDTLDHMATQMEGDALGITVSDAEVHRDIMKMQTGYDDEESFYKAMAEIGLDKEDLQQDAYYKLLIEKIATHNIQVSDKLVDQYIQSHPEEFKGYIQLRIQQIITDTKDKADLIETKLHNGTSFDELAKSSSLDDATRNNGGDLGWVEEDDPFIDSHILQAAKTMQEGQISEPVKLESGYAIVKLNGRKDVNKLNGMQSREEVRMDLALQEAPPLKDVINRLREKYHATILDASLK